MALWPLALSANLTFRSNQSIHRRCTHTHARAGREPCPYRIVDDVGGAFCMGSIGGGIWHYFKGVRNAPKGERLRGGISSVKARAPVVGGAWAACELERGGGRIHIPYPIDWLGSYTPTKPT